MKKQFLEIVNEVKSTGIKEKICATSNANELRTTWIKFLKDYPEIIEKIDEWADDFPGHCVAVFEEGEEITNPIEIVFVIHIIGRCDLSECEIFEYPEDLTASIEKTGDFFARRLVDLIDDNYICDLTAEDFFC